MVTPRYTQLNLPKASPSHLNLVYYGNYSITLSSMKDDSAINPNKMNEFKRAEMACELAHEDKEYYTPAKKVRDYKEFRRLTDKKFRTELEELKLTAVKKRNPWH